MSNHAPGNTPKLKKVRELTFFKFRRICFYKHKKEDGIMKLVVFLAEKNSQTSVITIDAHYKIVYVNKKIVH